MSSRNNNNRSQGGRGRGRGRGGRGGRGRRTKKFVRAKPVCVPKYDGPVVGSDAYSAMHADNTVGHDFSGYDALPEELVPRSFSLNKTNDAYYQGLQQTMMDFGWRLNEDENGRMYFTHPTYNGVEYEVYTQKLKNGKTVSLPLINREDDPKGLGCTVIINYGTGHFSVETNEWRSYWDDRSGRRRAKYLTYLGNREKKRREYIEMAKTDPSIKVWTANTPRCDPETWKHSHSTLNKYQEFA